MIASTGRAADRSTAAPAEAEPLEARLRAALTARLAAGLSHDVRNPLNAMTIHLEVLAEKVREAGLGGTDKNLVAARAQITRVDEMMRRYADFAAGRAPVVAELHELLHHAASLCDHEVRRQGAGLAVDSPPGLRTALPPATLLLLLVAIMLALVPALSRGGRLLLSASGGDELLIRGEVEGADAAGIDLTAPQAMARSLGAELRHDRGFSLLLPPA